MNETVKHMLCKELSGDEVHALNALLSAEIAAVETYNRAIQNIKEIELIPMLEACRNSHALNLERLRGRIEELGYPPAKGGGILGGLTQLVEEGASRVSDKAAIAILVGAEDFELTEYEMRMNALDPVSWKLVDDELLPAQKGAQRIAHLLHAALQCVDSE